MIWLQLALTISGIGVELYAIRTTDLRSEGGRLTLSVSLLPWCVALLLLAASLVVFALDR